MAKPILGTPSTVCLLGLGASALDYIRATIGQDLETEWDQVWTINMGCRVFKHDVVWAIDDLRAQMKKYPAYTRALVANDKPIMTSTVYPEFPTSLRYPIEEIAKEVGDDFLRNTTAYAIAYAMVTGVKVLTLFGCDFFYPDQTIHEEGAMNAAYFLGMARYFGMKFQIPQSSTLLMSHLTVDGADGQLHRPLYGYVKQPLFSTGESDGTGPAQGARLRASEGNHANPHESPQPGRQAKGGTRSTATVHPEGQGIQRGRRRGARPAGVVRRGIAQSCAIGPDGSRLGTTTTATGEEVRFPDGNDHPDV